MAGSHGVQSAIGPAGTREGLRAITISAVALGAAAAFQLVIFAVTGSAGLFAAGLDNLGDVVTTSTLAIAFIATRRAADRRYTFGYSRFEDLAGVLVVIVIWGSAGIAAWESYRRLVGEHVVTSLGIGVASALAGAVANEVVARYKIATGRRIGSPPLAADGQHARIDALASLAAAGGLAGVKLGWADADPVAGLLVTLAIVAIAWDASRHVLERLLDAVDPELVPSIERLARATPGVAQVGRVQARYAGRSLYVTMTLAAEGNLSLEQAHAVGEAVHHKICHELPEVVQVDVHVDPWEPHGEQAHPETARHSPRREHGHEH